MHLGSYLGPWGPLHVLSHPHGGTKVPRNWREPVLLTGLSKFLLALRPLALHCQNQVTRPSLEVSWEELPKGMAGGRHVSLEAMGIYHK